MSAIKLEPRNVIPSGSWGHDVAFKVTEPTNGARFCFNVVITYSNTWTRVYENLEDNSSLLKRTWHAVARRWRK